MTKLIATEMAAKPYIYWQTWDGPDGPLVINEADMPAFQFGVCPWKIEGGELVARDSEEMAAFEAEYNVEQGQKDYISKVDVLANETFGWDGNIFPMYETARLYYGCMQYAPGSNYKVFDIDGVQQTILAADVAGFIDAYYVKLTSLMEP